MKKMINTVHLEGRVHSHALEIKRVENKDSKNFGTEYIRGTLSVATDNEDLNVVTVNYTYVTPKTSKDTENRTFTALKKIMDENKTIENVGFDAAQMVRIDSSINLNEFYTDRSGKEELVSTMRCEGGFITLVNKLSDNPKDWNKFEVDIVMNGIRSVEADGERIKEPYDVIRGGIFNFREELLPIELIVKNQGGINYFESLEPSPSNLVFTKVWGMIINSTIETVTTEESAFGEASVRKSTRSIREWVVTGTAKEVYDFDDENILTKEDVNKAVEKHNVSLADIKKRSDEYKATRAASKSAPAATVAAAAGEFNF